MARRFTTSAMPSIRNTVPNPVIPVKRDLCVTNSPHSDPSRHVTLSEAEGACLRSRATYWERFILIESHTVIGGEGYAAAADGARADMDVATHTG